MFAIGLCALLVIGASIAIGRALMYLLGWREPSWLAGAVGLAALVVAAPVLIRLPGRGLTAAILLAALVIVAAVVTKRATPSRQGAAGGPRAPHATALAVIVITLAIASLPFLFNERAGVLGEGIYTNDHAAQLYWADWLADGFGPRPKAVAFGYPVGPQALVAALSEGTTIDLEPAFNGLLLAIPVLTALAALALLGALPPARRVAAACLSGLPYLAASFLAQSGFKETTMALLVLALAVTLHQGLHGPPAPGRPAQPPLATLLIVLVLALAAIFTFSIPGAAWFVLALGALMAIRFAAGERAVDVGAAREWAGRHRVPLTAAGVLLAGLAVVAVGPGVDFVSKINDVQQSRGRLSSPVFGGEALGIWPEGDFRVVRGDVAGAIPAVLFAFACAALAGLALLRRREWALLSVAGAAVAVYGLARPFAEIHVEAKALVVLAPIATVITVRWLLAPADGTRGGRLRLAAGAVFVIAAGVSTLLALRAAPVSFDQRADALERLGERIQGESVIFLGLDRFAAYRLRGTLVESPGGYVPPEVKARPQKAWQQGEAIDFDTVKSRKLDHFDYAITTDAAYQSEPPPNWRSLARDGGYVLWKRSGATPVTRVLNEGGAPGDFLDCSKPLGAQVQKRARSALVRTPPVARQQADWSLASPFAAPAGARAKLRLPGGRWAISLQYHSQVPLTVSVGGGQAELPPSLDGFYQSGPGRGAFFHAGLTQPLPAGGATVVVSVHAAQPAALQDALGVERRVWLGTVAATPAGSVAGIDRTGILIEGAARSGPHRPSFCGRYIDHYTVESR